MSPTNASQAPSTLGIGIDIGGTGTKGGIVDLSTGELVGERFRIPTPKPATPEAVADVVKQIVAELQSRPGAPAPDSACGMLPSCRPRCPRRPTAVASEGG